MKKECSLCNRIEEIKKGVNPYFVKELKTGYVIIGYYQFYRGYTIFICKKHVSELYELNNEFKQEFLNEMSLVAEAVWRSFKPLKLNYEMLGNTHSHAHWHIFPRYADDPNPLKPIWITDEKIRNADNTKPDQKLLEELKRELKSKIEELLQKNRKV